MGERTGRTIGIEGMRDKDKVHSSTAEGKRPNQEGREGK
jgi:hypothetical protein